MCREIAIPAAAKNGRTVRHYRQSQSLIFIGPKSFRLGAWPRSATTVAQLPQSRDAAAEVIAHIFDEIQSEVGKSPLIRDSRHQIQFAGNVPFIRF
jgi:hypothetical protein